MTDDLDTDETKEYPMDAYKDEATLRELYESGLSQTQIADRLSCSQITVSNWMKKHGILVGRHSEHYSRKNDSDTNVK
jgi:predicted transcriptional regulator